MGCRVLFSNNKDNSNYNLDNYYCGIRTPDDK